MAQAELTQSQFQLASTLVKQSAAASEARRKASLLNRADLAGDPQLRDNRRALEALLASYFAKSGLDLEHFEQINTKNQGDLRRIGEARETAAIKQSSSNMEALREVVAGRRKALEFLTNKATPATSFPNVVLEAPFMITGTAGLVLASSNIENWNSTAKFRIDSVTSSASGPGTGGLPSLSFWYVWVNPNETFALITVSSALAFNGFVRIGSNGGTFPGDRASGLEIDATLSLPGATSPVSQPLQSQTVVNLSTDTGGFFSVGALAVPDPNPISDAYFLQLSEAIVPPGEMLFIEVALGMNYFCSDGNVLIDCSSGDYNILSSFVSVQILS
jgi:hypothetical protein